jgi:hypothetical protein
MNFSAIATMGRKTHPEADHIRAGVIASQCTEPNLTLGAIRRKHCGQELCLLTLH